MSIRLEDYAELLGDLAPGSRELLVAQWGEATRLFSPRGLDNYLKGAAALQRLGRGSGVVDTWIEETPQVARELGEDVVGELITAALNFASKTSGAVIELVLATAPTAARRLGDAHLFIAYLQFLNTLIAQAPRGIRPMLDKLDVLLGQLTLGGLRRWATWGAHAHRTNYEEQVRYFGLDSKESLAVLQKERKGTLFVDIQRRINMYLRALWGRDFFLRPTSGDYETREGYRPYIENYLIHLPDAFDAWTPPPNFLPQSGSSKLPSPPGRGVGGEGSATTRGVGGEGSATTRGVGGEGSPTTGGVGGEGSATLPSPSGRGAGGEGGLGASPKAISGLALYRAAAAHCAAHLVETREPISAEALNPLQMAVIAVIEDARVETLAIRRFPGLRQLWASLHAATPEREASIGDWLDRLARALLDEGYADPDPWIARGRELFRAAEDRLGSNRIAWDIGVELAHALKAKGLAYNPRTDLLSAPYRDDNRYVWEFEEFDFEKSVAAGFQTERQVRKHVNLMEFVNEIDVETAGDDAQEIWVLGSELYDDDGTTWNEREGKEPVSDPYHYPEWDYQIQLERPSWATVLEKRAKAGELALIDDIAAQHKRIVSRMKFLLDAMQPQGVTRIRKLEDGDDIDVNAAIASTIDRRLGMQPDARIMMRSVRKVRDIAVLVLLDLSESTNEKVAGQDYTVLELTRQACVLLADAIARVGDPFAIHGFCSDGRHDVEYYRFKDFDQPYGELPKARLAGMTGQLSTRMGAAVRHAAHYLRLQKSSKKLLLVITDGEPADVDVRDPQYLRYDTKKAVEEAARLGIVTYCMSLDPRADQYVSRIFGARNYMIVDHVERLPERLPLLYAGLTR